MGPAHACGLAQFCRAGLVLAAAVAPFPWGWISGNRATSCFTLLGEKLWDVGGSHGVGTRSCSLSTPEPQL